MATVKVKVKFRPSTVGGRPGSIVYFVTHRRATRQITTKHKVFPCEWDERHANLVAPPGSERAGTIMDIAQRIHRDLDMLDRIIDSLGYGGHEFTTDEIINLFRGNVQGKSFCGFMYEIILYLQRLGKERTAENYMTARNSFIRFLNGKDIPLIEMDSDLATEYEAYLKSLGITMNTVSCYNRILRAVYNRAVEKGLAAQRYPFKHVYTGIDKTVKRAINLRTVKQIKDLELPMGSSLDFARDMFLFSFYTRGMSFIDMAFLRKKDLQDGILAYRRRKTGQMLLIKWEKSMQEIIDKYPENESAYLLPIIKTNRNERLQYRNAHRLVNNKLKKISALMDIPVKLTMYVSRHSWASIAQSQNIPLSVISAGMGHDSENTTQIYLTSLDHSTIDKANDLILRKLR